MGVRVMIAKKKDREASERMGVRGVVLFLQPMSLYSRAVPFIRRGWVDRRVRTMLEGYSPNLQDAV